PPPAGAALRTAKFAAEPSEGGVAARAGVARAPSIPDAIRIARETVPKTRGPTRRSSLPAALLSSAICLQLAHRTRAPLPVNVLDTLTLEIRSSFVDMLQIICCDDQDVRQGR